jgi:3-dehydroquinate synthase
MVNATNGSSKIEGSDMTASVTVTKEGFQVKGAEELNYGFIMLDDVFNQKNEQLADLYRPWKRCLLVVRCPRAILYRPAES